MTRIPVLDGALTLAGAGVVTGASARNWASYGDDVRLAPALSAAQRALLCDPQTSGGLLVACDPGALPQVMDAFASQGGVQAALIGTMVAGEAAVEVEL
jgi:selenide,water dikinase